MLTTIRSIKFCGIQAVPVSVEVQTFDSQLGIHLVGLGDSSVRESLLRIVTALQSKGFRIPGKKIIINLSPADLRKDSSVYDLPIALAILSSSGQVYLPGVEEFVVIGELGLDGSVRGVSGAVQAVDFALSNGLRCVVPQDNALEVAEIFGPGVPVYAVRSLDEAAEVFGGSHTTTAWDVLEASFPKGVRPRETSPACSAWGNIKGNGAAVRALKIAAAGGHGVLLMGAPGSGKSLLAKALCELLPDLGHDDALEVSKVYSAAGRGASRVLAASERPFRSPHFSASLVSMLGGGSGTGVLPGEVSLADHGVLFLDEITQFPKSLTEVFANVAEDSKVVISRLNYKVEYPAKAQLVLATAPCPCGYYGEGDRCRCTPAQREAFLSRLPYRLMDRVGVQVFTHPITAGADGPAESLETARAQVLAARDRQKARYASEGFQTNDGIPARDLERFCHLDDGCRELVEKLVVRLGLSVRAYGWILRLALTIADLAGSDTVKPEHLAEAAAYRFLDRFPVADTSLAQRV